MDSKRFIPAIGAGGMILASMYLFKWVPKLNISKFAPKIIEGPERIFEGVPISKLNELAKEIHPASYCTMEPGTSKFLVLHYKSNRGRTMRSVQMFLDSTGMLRSSEIFYPGQLRSYASEFMKRVNELHTFVK